MGLLKSAVLFLLSLAVTSSGCNGLRTDGILLQHPGDWTMFGRTTGNASRMADTISTPLTQEWDAGIGASLGTGSPLIFDSLVIVGTLRGELCALSLRTGKTIGSVSLGEAIHGSPVIDHRMVYAGLTGGTGGVVCFDIVEGKLAWKVPLGEIEMSPLLLHQRLFLGTIGGKFACLDAVTGRKIWTFELPHNVKRDGIRSSPATDSSQIVFGADDGGIYSLDGETGALLWSLSTGSEISAAPVLSGGLGAVGNRSGSVIAFDLSGGVRWRSETHSRIVGNAVFTDSVVVVGTLSGEVFGLRRSDGSRAWTTALGAPVSAGAMVSGSTVFYGTLGKELVAIDGATGSILWRGRVDGRVKSAAAGAAGWIIVATDEHTLYGFRGVEP
jgi:outer membrane protein assembly factor BamB